MTNQPPLRVGIVGAGYIASWHAKAIRRLGNTRLVGICDAVAARAEGLARTLGSDAGYGSLEQMLAEAKPDVVHVLVPPDHHFSTTQAALKAGVHVLVEKPMGLTGDECAVLNRLAGERGLRLGVGHNFTFYPAYERLRSDVRSGRLGWIEQVVLNWHSDLPQLRTGPFDAWMLREPGNIALEIGSHLASQMLDLVGEPETFEVHADREIELPGGRRFYRRWRIDAEAGRTAVEIRMSFRPGIADRSVRVRGAFGRASADIETDTYQIDRHTHVREEVDLCARAAAIGRGLRKQSRDNLLGYVLSKAGVGHGGNPFGVSIERSIAAFYDAVRTGGAVEERLSGERGQRVIEWGNAVASRLPPGEREVQARPYEPTPVRPSVLVLGGTGFIGKHLVDRLLADGQSVRVLTRSMGASPWPAGTPGLEVVQGGLQNEAVLRDVMRGIETVYHLARASNARTWEEFQSQDVQATECVARACLAAGVKRLIYSGTIASLYTGAKAAPITDDTPLDPRIHRRGHYPRAKALCEAALLRMHREERLPVVIARPGIVLGPGSTPMHWGVGMWNGLGTVQLWGTGDHKLPLVLVSDVVDALVRMSSAPNIEGHAFNLVGPPLLSAREYLAEIEKHTGVELQKRATPIWRFYAVDMFKWAVKVAVRHPDRHRPSYRDWESRNHKASFRCDKSETLLGWRPTPDVRRLVDEGIHAPLDELMGTRRAAVAPTPELQPVS